MMQWHAATTAEVATGLDVDPSEGLTDQTAAERRNRFGPNQLREAERVSTTALFLRQFSDILIWVLIAAALVSGFLLDEWIDAAAIGVIVILNAALGFAQEARAENALADLQELTAPSALVRRRGTATSVSAANVVPGDVLVLEPGVRIAADARLVEAIHLRTDESLLTGESLPVDKQVEPVNPREAVVADRTVMVHAGTTVVAGRGAAVTVATGTETEVGKIAALLEQEQPATPLQITMAQVGRRLLVIALGAAILVFALGVLRDNPVERMILTAVALAVATIPEGLPAVVTISLAQGVQAMADRNALIRRLPAVEALGAADVICTDKTGTLTENRLTVQFWADCRGEEADPDAEWYRPAVFAAVLANDATTDIGDPTEVALVVAAIRAGVDPVGLRSAQPRLDEVGFDSARKRMTTLIGTENGPMAYTKGAPEVLVDLATGYATPEGVLPIDGTARAAFLEGADALARRGLRTLALARRRFDDVPSSLEDEERELVLLGMVAMADQIRAEARPAAARAHQAGIRVVMVTGDHLTTALAVARELDIADGPFVPGSELASLDPQSLASRVAMTGGYARVDPADKVKIVEAWQATGAVVAMTGDGVNDAPALRRADIGVAMGSGTDVARDTSDMVLADDNFATIVAAVEEGRRIFRNLRSVVHYLLSANASEIIVMLGGFLAFAGEPVTAIQLLWINLISDGLPALALGMQPATDDLMDGRRGHDRNLLAARSQLRLLGQGAVLAVAGLGSLFVGEVLMEARPATVQTMVFSALIVAQLFHAVNMAGPRPGRLLPWSILGSTVIHVLVVYTSLGQQVFGTIPLGWIEWAWVIGLSAVTFLVIRLTGLASPAEPEADQVRSAAASSSRNTST